MEIQFLIKDLNVKEPLLKNVQHLFTSCIEAIGLDIRTVETIYIAEDSQYGDAIHRVDPTATYTNDNGLIGVGKAISREDVKGEIVHSIVLREGIVDSALSCIISDQSIEELERTQRESLYVICHEIGHCVDNYERKILGFPKLRGNNDAFSIKRVSMYYSKLLACEFSACAHAAIFVSPELQTILIDDYIEELIKVKHGLEEFNAKYEEGVMPLYDLAYQVSGGFWFLLVQYAKLVGHTVGNNQIVLDQETHWPTEIFPLEVSKQMQSSLLGSWSQYPNWPSEAIIKNWTDCWHNFCLANEYSFRQEPTGDALYFNI